MSYRVGLTGGIGSGKSTVAELFAELGVPIIDTDVISHQLTQAGGAAIASIQQKFGNEYIDSAGALNRDLMRQRVFSDPLAKQNLENIIHPLILSQARSRAEASTAPYVMLVVPLLFESNDYQHWLDCTLLVDCTEDTQIRRTVSRSGLSESSVRSIMSQQLTRSQRALLADDTIQNEGDLPALKPQVERLHRHYLDLAARSN